MMSEMQGAQAVLTEVQRLQRQQLRLINRLSTIFDHLIQLLAPDGTPRLITNAAEWNELERLLDQALEDAGPHREEVPCVRGQ